MIWTPSSKTWARTKCRRASVADVYSDEFTEKGTTNIREFRPAEERRSPRHRVDDTRLQARPQADLRRV